MCYSYNLVAFLSLIKQSNLKNNHLKCLSVYVQGEWKPKQIDNPKYKGEWVHPEIDNPDYAADDKLYKYDDIGAIGFDLWQVRTQN